MEIVDIKPGTMKQGTTKPLLCEGRNGLTYVVKNKRTSTRGLIAEYLASSLAKKLEIPVPDFEILKVSAALAERSLHEDARGLATLPSFGSRYIEGAVEIAIDHVQTIEDGLRARILLFDWWIANADRRGWTKLQWNPNLLWVPSKGELIAIDHNMAFERWNVDEPAAFWDSHIFAKEQALWDESFQARAQDDMSAALKNMDAIWDELPVEWTSVEEMLTKRAVADLLSRFSTDADRFWRRT